MSCVAGASKSKKSPMLIFLARSADVMFASYEGIPRVQS